MQRQRGQAFEVVVAILFIALIVWMVSCSVKRTEMQFAEENAGRKSARSDGAALLTKCQATVLQAAHFPSSVDFKTWDSEISKEPETDTTTVRAAYEAKNGFGNLIPQVAVCRFNAAGEITSFASNNR